MHIKQLKDCAEFIAGDNSRLKELLNPLKEPLKVNYSLALAKIEKGEKTIPHRLDNAEVYFIVKGRARMHINGKESTVKIHDTVYIPPGAVQYIENIGNKDLEFLCIVEPPWRPEIEQVIKDE